MSARPSAILLGAAGLALTALSAPVFAQARTAPVASKPMMASVDTMLLHGLRYRNVGPPRGGRVTTVTGVPSQPRTFYMGVASGGLFKTTDAGASWMPITDGKVPVASTGSVDVSDSDPNIIYLGTGSDDIRSNVSTGRGVYKSTDAGATLELRRPLQRRADRRASHPSDESEHRLGRGERRRVLAEPRARRLQDDRRRQDVEERRCS